ncbi:hypothetical protein ACIBO2_18590 [Nonomuraea sp. NPDC050022]|uniref:hypothetical protein n=1 Tax=unclassified Nonomuraea TaxID=2593643 RepID=UPI0033CD89CE
MPWFSPGTARGVAVGRRSASARAPAISHGMVPVPCIAEIRKHWHTGHRWPADIESLRVIHPGLRTLTDRLSESGAAAIRAHLTTP